MMNNADMFYNRKVLVEVLIYHWPTSTSSCFCGWAELGHSHPEHVADIYETTIAYDSRKEENDNTT
jgi:hypothetical protein